MEQKKSTNLISLKSELYIVLKYFLTRANTDLNT